MNKLKFERYDENKHKNLICNWQNDSECANNNRERFVEFGLLEDFKDLNILLNIYADIPTSNEETYKYIVFDDNKDIGIVVLNWTCLDNRDKMLAVFHLIVRPKEQGKHYGTTIMNEIIDNGEILVKHDFNEICASVDQKNYPCQDMMKKLGFEKECEGPKYIMYCLKERERCV